MDIQVQDHPEILNHLDPTLTYLPAARRVVRTGQTFVEVRQTSEYEGDVVVFVKEAGRFRPIRNLTEERTLGYRDDSNAQISRLGVPCQASPALDYTKLFQCILEQVDVFDSSGGPDDGNLACVWVLRHLAKQALGRWITRNDLTTDFDHELTRCYAPSTSHEDIPPGGIVISPTEWALTRRTGHVGFLGAMQRDGARKIYSNSSSAARFKQNFTVDGWAERYKTRKGLQVRYYKLPLYVAAPSV